jgi:hypothetical protein
MKQFFLIGTLVLSVACTAQTNSKSKPADAVITVAEVERIETVLAHDNMQGRRAGTPGSDKAAAFIAEEFKKAGLQPAAGGSYLQTFTVVRPKFKSVKGEMDDVELDEKAIIVVTHEKDLKVNEKMGYMSETIKAGENLFARAQSLVRDGKNTVVYVDTSFRSNFSRLAGLKRMGFKNKQNLIFVLGTYSPKEFNIKAEHEFEEVQMANVVGMLPGKSKKEEQVIFSAHYDHIGVGKPVAGDSIFNGANDDAAGTTAVIMLAKYFKQLGNNERTLVFAAFTAEEIGGFGAQYFSQQFDPKNVAAMFNIEMIGTESKWGRNSAYITGFEKSSMGEILQANLKGSPFMFHPDPYTEQNLFYRSDNATLARLGVPAHTISTSKMDNEPNYHKVTDHVETLDLANMTEIIKAIAVSSATIVSGKETPSRVDTSTLR